MPGTLKKSTAEFLSVGVGINPSRTSYHEQQDAFADNGVRKRSDTGVSGGSGGEPETWGQIALNMPKKGVL